MQRCLTIAYRGISEVQSNPMVGSVIVNHHKIVSEGYHERYGGYHAERNAILNCKNKELLQGATLYVSLEPCNHHGKTPPCTDIIIDSGIKKVFIAQLDPNPMMSGKSIKILEQAGIDVHVGLLNKEARHLNRRFIINHVEQLPYIMLKYAKSSDGFIGAKDRQVWLSNSQSKLAVHKLRAEYQAILIGTNTAIIDNPKLTTRAYPGKSPIRIVIDRHHRIPTTHHILSDEKETLIYTYKESYPGVNEKKIAVTIPQDVTSELEWIMRDLYHRSITNVIIEGGSRLLQSMIQNNLWHEALIIETPVILNEGIKSPTIRGKKYQEFNLGDNKLLKIKSLRLDRILNTEMVKVPLIKVN